MLKKQTHIVFGDSAKGTLEHSSKLKSILAEVISLNDDLRIGPISNLNTEKGINKRLEWFRNTFGSTLKESNYFSDLLDSDVKKIDKIKQLLKKGQEAYIWCGSTSFDQMATARLLNEIGTFSNEIFILKIPKEERIVSETGIPFHPACLAIMNPNQVHLLEKHFKLLLAGELKNWANLWDLISKESGTMRISSNGKIETVLDSYFDNELLFSCSNKFEKAAKVIGKSFVNIGLQTSDSTLNWRLKDLVQLNVLEAKGNLAEIRDYEVRLPR